MLILSRNKHVRVHALSVMEICLLLKNDQENSDPDTYPLPSLVVTVGWGIEPRTLTVLASPALLTSSALLTSPLLASSALLCQDTVMLSLRPCSSGAGSSVFVSGRWGGVAVSWPLGKDREVTSAAAPSVFLGLQTLLSLLLICAVWTLFT